MDANYVPEVTDLGRGGWGLPRIAHRGEAAADATGGMGAGRICRRRKKFGPRVSA